MKNAVLFYLLIRVFVCCFVNTKTSKGPITNAHTPICRVLAIAAPSTTIFPCISVDSAVAISAVYSIITHGISFYGDEYWFFLCSFKMRTEVVDPVVFRGENKIIISCIIALLYQAVYVESRYLVCIFHRLEKKIYLFGVECWFFSLMNICVFVCPVVHTCYF